MSQDLHFFKLKIFSEDCAQLFKRDEIHNALKALLENRDLEDDTKLQDRIFEEIDVDDDIDLSAYTLKIEDLLKDKNLFLSNSRIFLMTEEIWLVIDKYIKECTKKNENENSSKQDGEKGMLTQDKDNDEFKKKLNTPMLKDYSMLDELFKKNLLIVKLIIYLVGCVRILNLDYIA